MEDQMKRRLVGAVVLVSLAVIFLPMLVDESVSVTEEIRETNIPPKPSELETFQSNVMTLPDDEPLIPAVDDAPYAEPEAAPAEVEVVESTPEPDPEPAALPEVRTGLSAWVVQVASLSSNERAKTLVDDLRKKGFSAFVEQVSVNGKDLFRVRVGPEIDRKRAEVMAAEIDKTFKLTSQIRRYP